jgi:hypothetical protein
MTNEKQTIEKEARISYSVETLTIMKGGMK